MKKISILICLTFLGGWIIAQSPKTIKLNPPDLTRGFPVMKALSLRASDREFDTTSLKLQDLSDLLWAANGINRPAIGKRTAPSAMNAQDIDIYVFLKSGTYLYNAKEQALDMIIDGDNRTLFAGRQEHSSPALICLLVSDISRFKFGADSLKLVWSAEDAGIVSQNIGIFCASVGLATRPRAGMNQQKLRELLKLNHSQYPMLNHPVAYKKE